MRLADVLSGLGQDAQAVMEARRRATPPRRALRTQTDEAARLGIFGAPSFVTPDGELFWGNDRLDAALDWAKR